MIVFWINGSLASPFKEIGMAEVLLWLAENFGNTYIS